LLDNAWYLGTRQGKGWCSPRLMASRIHLPVAFFRCSFRRISGANKERIKTAHLNVVSRTSGWHVDRAAAPATHPPDSCFSVPRYPEHPSKLYLLGNSSTCLGSQYEICTARKARMSATWRPDCGHRNLGDRHSKESQQQWRIYRHISVGALFAVTLPLLEIFSLFPQSLIHKILYQHLMW